MTPTQEGGQQKGQCEKQCELGAIAHQTIAQQGDGKPSVDRMA